MDRDLEPVERGFDKTGPEAWLTDRQIMAIERRQKEAYDMTDLMEEIDEDCIMLAKADRAMALGTLLIDKMKDTINRRINEEMK